MKRLPIVMLLCGSLCLTACQEESATLSFNGYVEAVQFYISAPQAGWIESQPVIEGSRVEVGDAVSVLDDEAQQLAVLQAEAQLAVAAEQLMDLQQGAREEEVAVSEQLLQAQQARLKEARLAFERQRRLLADKLTSQSQYDQAEAAFNVAASQVEQTRRQLNVLQLPARKHAIEAARKQHDAAQQVLALQQWQLEQRRITARSAGTVEQIYYRKGEFVRQGLPILSLLVPGGLKARFYVPEHLLSTLHTGQAVSVRNDNGDGAKAHISYIAQEPEYAPPVLYSNDSREELVFLVEATLEGDAYLRPGQPVDVQL